MRTVRTSKELGEALKNNESYIYVEGDLKNKVLKIKVAGRLAWAIAGGSIATAVALYIATPAATAATAGVGGAISFTGSAAAASVATTVLGIPATTVAIYIAVAAGGFGAITSLRNNYTIERKDANGMLLKKK